MPPALPLILALAFAGPGQAHQRALRAVTAPSMDLTLAFTHPGRIAEVLVREGQAVPAGKVLVRLDDAVERLQLELLKARAGNTAAVRAAELRARRAQAMLRKVQQARDANAAPQRELDDARDNAALAAIDLEAARFQLAQDRNLYEQARLKLLRMRLAAPADARVERLFVRPGQAVDALAPAIRLVRIDPLWIDVPVPVAAARALRPGATALVCFADADAPARATIRRIAAVADAASETLEVRLELPNPHHRPAGEQVAVRFPGQERPPAPPGRVQSSGQRRTDRP